MRLNSAIFHIEQYSSLSKRTKMRTFPQVKFLTIRKCVYIYNIHDPLPRHRITPFATQRKPISLFNTHTQRRANMRSIDAIINSAAINVALSRDDCSSSRAV